MNKMSRPSDYIEPSLSYSDVLLRDYPDAGYEYFWLNFKDSVSNITRHGGTACTPKTVALSREVPVLTNKLNNLQALGQYDQIGVEIQRFLKIFLHCVFKESDYHINIARTNLKRWLKYCQYRRDVPKDGVAPMDPLDDPEMKYLYFLHQLYGLDRGAPVVEVVDLQESDALDHLLQWAYTNRCHSALNKFLACYHDWTRNRILELYGNKLPKGMLNSSKIKFNS